MPDSFRGLRGCLGRLLSIGLMVACACLLVLVIQLVTPQDLSDLELEGTAAAESSVPPMGSVLRHAIKGNYAVTLDEGQINRWLERAIKPRQSGWLENWVSLRRVWVRLHDGYGEIILERRIFNRPWTVSMFVQTEIKEGDSGRYTEVHLQGGPYHGDFPKPLRGGRFGNLVVPQGFLLLVLPSYRSLETALHDELQLGFEEMSQIRMEKGQLILDPNPPKPAHSPVP